MSIPDLLQSEFLICKETGSPCSKRSQQSWRFSASAFLSRTPSMPSGPEKPGMTHAALRQPRQNVHVAQKPLIAVICADTP